MPPRIVQTVTVFVFDLGFYSTKCMDDHELSYLDKVKQIMINLIKKMIFLSQNDSVGLVCGGYDQTENKLNYPHIKTCNPKVPDWNTLKIIQNLKNGTKSVMFEKSIEVAYNMLSEYIEKNGDSFRIRDAQIIYFHNFLDNSMEQNHNFKRILTYCDSNIKLYCIGEKRLDVLKKEMHDNLQVKNFIDFIEKACDIYWTMSFKLKDSKSIGPKPVNSVPSNIALEYLNVKIPIAVYKCLEDETKKPSLKSEQSRVTEYLDNNKDLVEKNDIIRAYKFGHKLVPVSIDDEERIKYQSGDKSLKILGFVPSNDISIDRWGTSPVKLIIPAKTCTDNHLLDFTSFYESMRRNNRVAIVRILLRANESPKVGFMYPNESATLKIKSCLFIELPFEEEQYSQYFQPIPKTFEIDSEILESVESFTQSLELSNNGHCHFMPESINNPAVDVYWHAIALRIQNQNEPLPEVKSSQFYDSLKRPESLDMASQESREKLLKAYQKHVKIPEMMELSQAESQMDTSQMSLSAPKDETQDMSAEITQEFLEEINFDDDF